MDAQLLYSILSNAWDMDVHDSHPRSYSGRAMYSERCIAVKVSEPADLVKLAFWAGQNYGEQLDAEEFISGMCSDWLGMGMIYYWPEHEWSDEMKEQN